MPDDDIRAEVATEAVNNAYCTGVIPCLVSVGRRNYDFYLSQVITTLPLPIELNKIYVDCSALHRNTQLSNKELAKCNRTYLYASSQVISSI